MKILKHVYHHHIIHMIVITNWTTNFDSNLLMSALFMCMIVLAFSFIQTKYIYVFFNSQGKLGQRLKDYPWLEKIPNLEEAECVFCRCIVGWQRKSHILDHARSKKHIKVILF